MQSATLVLAEKLPQRCFQAMKQMQEVKVTVNKGVCVFKRMWQAELNVSRWWCWWGCTPSSVNLEQSRGFCGMSWAAEWSLGAPKLGMNQFAELSALLVRVFGYFPFQIPSLNFLLCLGKTCSFLDQGLFLVFVSLWLSLMLFFSKYLLQVHFRGCVIWEFFWCWRALSKACLHFMC